MSLSFQTEEFSLKANDIYYKVDTHTCATYFRIDIVEDMIIYISTSIYILFIYSIWPGLISLYHGIIAFVSQLMPKPSLLKNSCSSS